jgi:8-oxo-dGTP diphosphatase
VTSPEPALAVGAIVVHEGRLLLVRRLRPPAAGTWTVPGGRVEPGETLTEAVAREVLEETGLTVEVGDLAGWVERAGEGYHFVILDFLARVAGDRVEPVPGDDAADARWVEPEVLSELPLVAGLADFLRDHGIWPSPGPSLGDG